MPKPSVCQECRSCHRNCRPEDLRVVEGLPEEPLSNQSLFIIEAIRRGYRVARDGSLLSFRKKKDGSPRILKPSIKKTGSDKNGGAGVRKYYAFAIEVSDGKLNTRTARIMVHRMAAYQKFGRLLFRKGVQVRHLDNNPGNNAYDNLCLGDRRANYFDLDEGTRKEIVRRIEQTRQANRRKK